MSLDTYTGLQAAILAKLMRTNDADAIARIPDWITMAENELRMALTRLTLRQGEVVNSSYVIAGEYNALPTGFLRQRNLKITSPSVMQLDYIAPETADSWSIEQAALPRLYTIQGNQLRVFPVPDVTYTATFTFYSLTPLSVTNTTNWLLTAHPKLYFVATLAEAFAYYEKEDGLQIAISERERMLSAIYTSDGADQQGSNMRIRVRGNTP